MKLSDVPCWLRNGSIYESMIESEDVDFTMDSHKIKDSPKINKLKNFIKIYKLSNYWNLHRYPMEIYVYAFLNKQEVIDFLKNEETSSSKLLIEDIENNFSIDKYKGIISEDFKDPKIIDYYENCPVNLLKKNENIKKSFDVISDLMKIKKTKNHEDLIRKLSKAFTNKGFKQKVGIFEDSEIPTVCFELGEDWDFCYYSIIGCGIKTFFDNKYIKDNGFVVQPILFNWKTTCFIAISVYQIKEQDDDERVYDQLRFGSEDDMLSSIIHKVGKKVKHLGF